jgi:4-coumarate--CoA ligase (photoactive yellow protein activation family)
VRLSRAAIRRILTSLAAAVGSSRADGIDFRLSAIRAGEFFMLPELENPGHALDTLIEAIFSGWPGERLAFQTSGSTGEPKRLVMETLWLMQESHFLAGLFAGRSRVVGLVPPHHIYGFLFTVLLPEALGVAVLDLDPHFPTAVQAALAPGDLVIGFPLVWKVLAKSGTAYPRDVWGVTSTGPCPAEVINAAVGAGLLSMTEIHGATETGGLGWRRSPRDPYRLMDHWLTPKTPDMLERLHPDGLTNAAFALPDGFDMAGERFYRPSGRKDEAVQIAGVNVYPERSRRALLCCPLVAEAAVRPMRPDEGDRLKAFIVLSRPVNTDEAVREIRVHLAGHLAPHEMPRSFTFGQELPRSALGKYTDWNAAILERDDHD